MLAVRSVFSPVHLPQPGLQSAVVALTSLILRILAGVRQRRRDQVHDHDRQGRRLFGDALHRLNVRGQWRGEDLRAEEMPLSRETKASMTSVPFDTCTNRPSLISAGVLEARPFPCVKLTCSE